MSKRSRIIIVICLGLLLNGCEIAPHYYEDKVYSEKDLKDYTPKKTSSNGEVITREEAINRAIYLFEKGFDRKFNKEAMKEYISLKNRDGESFSWNINWIDEAGNTYVCEMNSVDGTILYMSTYINEGNTTIPQKTDYSEETLLNIATPLFQELKIDINDYKMEPLYEGYGSKFNNEIYMYFYSYDKEGWKKNFRLGFDLSNNRIVKYDMMNMR